MLYVDLKPSEIMTDNLQPVGWHGSYNVDLLATAAAPRPSTIHPSRFGSDASLSHPSGSHLERAARPRNSVSSGSAIASSIDWTRSRVRQHQLLANTLGSLRCVADGGATASGVCHVQRCSQTRWWRWRLARPVDILLQQLALNRLLRWGVHHLQTRSELGVLDRDHHVDILPIYQRDCARDEERRVSSFCAPLC